MELSSLSALPSLTRLPVPVFVSDAAGRVFFANDSWLNQIGVAEGELWLTVFPGIHDGSVIGYNPKHDHRPGMKSSSSPWLMTKANRGCWGHCSTSQIES
jgi:hypothetical protein